MAHSTKRHLATLAVGFIAFVMVACGGYTSTISAVTTNPILDTTFGTNGILTLPLSVSTHDRFLAITVAPDGKIYAAGFMIEGGDQVMTLVRLGQNGTLDKTFGKDGLAAINVAPGGKIAEQARSVVVQSSGKIVIAGPVEHDVTASGDGARDTDIAVVRFDDTGKLDPSFGSNGIARIDLGAGRITTGTTFVGDNVWGMSNLPGDRIVLFGSKLADGAGRTDSDFVLIGLTNAGVLDAGFGAGGKVVIDIDKSVDTPRTVIVQPDGKIVATGYSAGADGVVTPVLIRVSAAGVLDTTFGKNGIAATKILPGVAESYAVGLQGDRFISAGYGRGANASEKVDIVVERYKPDGSLDTTFGKDGLTRIDIAKEDDRARNLVVLPDDRILIVGSGKKSALKANALIVLLSKDGAIVKSFGEDGFVLSDLGGSTDAWYGIAMTPDKKYVYLAGYKGTEGSGNDDSVVARIKL